KKKEAQEKGYEVGSDLKMGASWNNGLMLQSENKDFRMHIGGRLQADYVWFQEPKALKASGALGGVPAGTSVAPGTGAIATSLGIPGSVGIGAFDDGAFFRRIRIQMDGAAYETFEWNSEVIFENITSVT